jgi:ribose transport system ATP-binding protein
VGDLSLAQGATLAIARALQDVEEGDAAVVVLDEPTGALPATEAHALHATLRDLTALGHAVVLVTHDIEEALTRCDTVTVLRDGVCIHSGPATELDRESLIHLIVGRADLAEGRAPNHPSMARAAPALEILRLEGDGLDVRDVAIAAGEIVGLAGMPNAGADVTLQAIFGLRPGVVCDIRVSGVPTVIGSPRQAMAKGIAYLPSDRLRDCAFRGLSVTENLGSASMRHVAPRGWIESRRERREALSLTTAFRVKPVDPNRTIETLSGGNQQKVLLARWARRNPCVLLLDDPTRGVDVGARADIWALLAERSQASGLAVLVTSTDPEELASFCDRVLVLGSGRVFTQLDGRSLDATHITAASYAASESKELPV